MVQKNLKKFLKNFMKNIDISKLPADVRKTFKKLQVMHAEKKIQIKLKMTSCPLSNVCGPIL